MYKHIRIASSLFQRLFINFSPPLLLMIIFKWCLIKELHLVTTTLLAAFIDISFHLLLGVFELYTPSLQLYPSNAIFCLLILITSYAIGNKRFPRNKIKALRVAFKLCAQFFCWNSNDVFVRLQNIPMGRKTTRNLKSSCGWNITLEYIAGKDNLSSLCNSFRGIQSSGDGVCSGSCRIWCSINCVSIYASRNG